ncbi:ankyrin repeat domain-containing protein 39 [Ostrinia nubilalis]|uniref:ankyrin repeat domain-containing protein 39 n=1 Tax=Ostrinia nubilalis TaxID=29057 RepID=UPI0030823EAA
MEHKSNCDHTNCTAANSNQSVCQTLSEMDWERGLWYAAFNGDIERVNALISKASNIKDTVNAPDNSGYTALHYAARNGHTDVCDILIKNGACIDAQTKSGKATPLHKAAAAGNTTAVKFLIDSGATVDMQDVDGQTALHKALENNKFELVRILLDACPQLHHINDFKGRRPNIPE